MSAKLPAIVAAGIASLAAAAVNADEWKTSYTLFGTPGLIDMPTAGRMEDGRMAATLSHAGNHTRVSVAFQATPRITGAFRYSSIDEYSGVGSRAMFDRSFDIQYRLFNEGKYTPAVAVGLRDFMGTGLYTSEYVVATKTIADRFQVTGGVGWGAMAERGAFENPFIRLSEKFKTRDRDFGLGGKPSVGQFFRGDAAFFGGVEYTLSPSLRVKAEYSSHAYTREDRLGTASPKSPFNFGLTYAPSERFQLGAYYMQGTDIGFTATMAINPNSAYAVAGNDPAPIPVGVVKPDPEAAASWTGGVSYDRKISGILAAAMEGEGLKLHGIETRGNVMRVRYENTRYRAESQGMGRLTRILSHVAPATITVFELEPVTRGLAKSQLVVRRSDVVALDNELGAADDLLTRVVVRDAGAKDGLTAARDFEPKLGWSISPYFSYTLFGTPEQPTYYQGGIRAAATYELAPNLWIDGELRQRLIATEAGEITLDPSPVPVVRTDIADYAQADGPQLQHLTVTHVGKIAPNVYTKVTGGYLERMYGGISAEALWKPADSRLGLGAELTYAIKRDPTGLGFGDYRKATGFVSAYYEFPNDYVGRIDVGRYLAGDWGGTLSLVREFPNGWQVGGYFTLTDIPFDEYGEGSFDKGLTISIPVDWLIGAPTREVRSATLRSLTRDGGARVDVGTGLYSMVRDGHMKDVADSWGRYWK